MKIQILTSESKNSGGIFTSIILLNELLKKGSIDVEISSTIGLADLYWFHEFNNLIKFKKTLKNKNIVIHVHDYRDVCLTGQKCFGKSFSACYRPLGLSCFYTHFFKGCGHSRNYLKLLFKLFKQKRRLKFFKNHNITVYSEFLKKQLIINGFNDKKVHVIPGFHRDFSTNLRKVIQDKKEFHLTLLWIGRLVEAKGCLEFLDTIIYLRHNGASINVKIIGEGILREKITKIIKDNSLESCVRLTGWIDEKNLTNEFAAANILIFNPRWPEPYGLVGPEAISAGVEVFTLNRGGISSWAENNKLVSIFSDNLSLRNELLRRCLKKETHFFEQEVKNQAEILERLFLDNFNK